MTTTVTDSTTGSTRRSLPSAIRNVLANWGGFVCSAVISFFISPFVVHHLGNSAYGVWVLVGSLTGYLGLLNLGVRATVTRYVARFYAESNDAEANAVASSAVGIFLVAGTIAILGSLILAAIVVPVFHVPVTFQFAARVVLILAGLNIATSLVSGVFSGVLAALHRFDLLNVIEVTSTLLSGLTIVLFLSLGKGLIALASIQFLFAAASGLVYIAAAFRTYPALSIRLSKCDREHLKLIFSFSVYSFLLQLSFNVIFYTDSIVIGAFLSVGLVTYFAIAGNLMNYSRMVISGISTTMTPRAGALEAMGQTQDIQLLLLKATRLATLVMLPIAVTFLLRGSSFIRLWMGPEYAAPSGQVLRILSLALIFVAGDQVATAIMLGISAHRTVVLMVCIIALCNLTLSIVLARTMGIVGVAWGTTLPSLAGSLLFWPWYLKRVLHLRVFDYILSAWLRPALAVAPFAILTYLVERMYPASNLATFFLQVALILPLVLIGAWYLCLDPPARRQYREKLMLPIFGPADTR